MPTISVLMPVYNADRFLAKAIESILAQTFTDFELLIVDDGSTDRSREMIDSYALSDQRIRPIYQGNQGISSALNAGFAIAEGEFIARMDGDDIALPYRFEHQLHFLRQNPKIGVVGSAMQDIDINNVIVPKKVHSGGSGPYFLKWLVIFGVPVAHPTVMMRTEALRSVGGYGAGVPAEDYDLWLRLVPTVLFDNMPEVLLLYRRHPQSYTNTKRQRLYADAAQRRQAHLKQLYDMEISLYEALSLQTNVTDSDAQAMALTQILQNLREGFARRNPTMSSKELLSLRKDYVSRLYQIWRLRRQLWTALRFIEGRDMGLLGPVVIRDLLATSGRAAQRFAR